MILVPFVEPTLNFSAFSIIEMKELRKGFADFSDGSFLLLRNKHSVILRHPDHAVLLLFIQYPV